ncbi:MAG: amidohydrolase family protein [Gemmatimonadota bacterium]
MKLRAGMREFAWILLATCAASTPVRAQAIAITGGTVYPVSGPKIENGTVILRDGKVVAVGKGLAVPAGATQVDATGKWVTPGLFHAATTLGLVEVSAIDGTTETSDTGDVNAAFNVSEGINPASVLIPIMRLEGLTTAVTLPSGGLISGQGVLIDLNGERIEDLIARSPVAMVINMDEGAKGAGGGSRAGIMARLRRVFHDAQEYERRAPDYRRAQMQPLAARAADLEALAPVLHGTLPVIVTANRRSDIDNALRLASEFHLRLIIRGGVEAWQAAAELAEAHVPVAIDPMANLPSFNGLGARLDNATLLRKAGVEVLLAEEDTYNYRNIRFMGGNAVRNGLTWDDALRSITLAPALAFGVGDHYGSLEAGKVANVVVWSGDPLDFASHAEHVYIRGVEMPHTSRQTELLGRYRTLPPQY